MRSSVLMTKDEIVKRVQSLYSQYQESVETIANSVSKIKKAVAAIGPIVMDTDDFDLDAVKPLLNDLNAQQTTLVNILKRMTELHAKMGYVVK
jgi:hypothetical protein